MVRFLCFLFILALIGNHTFANEQDSFYSVPEPKATPLQTVPLVKTTPEDSLNDDYFFKMQEYNTNYFISGDPDTKVQFSFKFNLVKNYSLFFGFTQIMFWDLETESKPFTDINYHPELFYNFKYKLASFDSFDFGYGHSSNGKAGLESRSYDSVFLRLISVRDFSYGVSSIHLTLRHLFRLDETNLDIRDFYGPVVLKFFFDKLGKKLFKSDECYLEFYTGGRFADIPKRSSFRVSFRFKIFSTKTAPKLFLQYFSGYGENLARYDQRDETFRVGFSLGGN